MNRKANVGMQELTHQLVQLKVIDLDMSRTKL
jgi:hypothetical protein